MPEYFDPFVISIVGPILVIAVALLGWHYVSNNPEKYSWFLNKVPPWIYLYFAVSGGFSGLFDEEPLWIVGFPIASFFGAYFVNLRRQGYSDKYRFGMLEVMVFMTIFAVLMGLRAAIH